MMARPMRPAVAHDCVYPDRPRPGRPRSLALGSVGGVPMDAASSTATRFRTSRRPPRRRRTMPNTGWIATPKCAATFREVRGPCTCHIRFKSRRGRTKSKCRSSRRGSHCNHLDARRPAAGRHLDGPFGRPLGRQHAGCRREPFHDWTWFSAIWRLPQRRVARRRALHARQFFDRGLTRRRYEVTIEDPECFHASLEDGHGPVSSTRKLTAQLMEYKCVELVEETFLGHLRKKQLVKHWEGEYNRDRRHRARFRRVKNSTSVDESE